MDKVQKIREEVEKLKLCTMDEHMKFYSDAAEAEYNALCNIEHFIDSLQEEPVSEDLKAASYDYVKSNHKDIASIDDCALLYDAIEFGAKWKEEQMMKNAIVMQAHTQDGELWGDIRKFNIEDGDKIKVIIIK